MNENGGILYQGGKLVTFGNFTVPEGTTILDSEIVIGPHGIIKVDGTVMNCLVSVDDETLNLEGSGEFSYNFIQTYDAYQETEKLATLQSRAPWHRRLWAWFRSYQT